MKNKMFIPFLVLLISLTGVFSNKLGVVLDSEMASMDDVDDTGPGSINEIFDFPSLDLDVSISEEDEELEDPCEDLYCEAGQECIITPKGEGICQCVAECEGVEDERRKVCSNQNTTWSSDCKLYRMRCLCVEDDKECLNQNFKHLHIDYYGSCQQVSKCEEAELKDFPRRMREWLLNVMNDMAVRNVLDDSSLELKEKVDQDSSFKWIGAAIWKWCQLDSDPKDKSVSRHEIFPVRAPLHTLEHCISPFLDSCDPDNDHYITLKEWANCLELSEEVTDDMEDLCEKIRD